ncbi:MAG: Arc family DNA-binding protein [Leptospiraceae bacterium]|nr:Arc family DNA-binding protein [Leptospiraceae bacterium]
MSNLTIRNIPTEMMNKIKTLSEIQKRSMNSEILFILEKGLLFENLQKSDKLLSKDTQVKIWNKLSGKWKDKRKTSEIIDDIYSTRSKGREFSL